MGRQHPGATMPFSWVRRKEQKNIFIGIQDICYLHSFLIIIVDRMSGSKIA